MKDRIHIRISRAWSCTAICYCSKAKLSIALKSELNLGSTGHILGVTMCPGLAGERPQWCSRERPEHLWNEA